MKTNYIEHGDAGEFLKSMKDKSVDVVFYDPPYNVKKKYDGYDDDRPPDEYIKWMSEIYRESDRVSRNGVIAYIGGRLVRTFGMIFSPSSKLIIVHQRAGVFAGQYMLHYHAIYSTVRPVKKIKDLWDDVRLVGEGYYFREARYDIPGLTSEALTDKVLDSFTKPGDIVLDPFMGTGTTAVCAVRSGRKYIGVEQSKKYINIANGRLNEIRKI